MLSESSFQHVLIKVVGRRLHHVFRHFSRSRMSITDFRSSANRIYLKAFFCQAILVSCHMSRREREKGNKEKGSKRKMNSPFRQKAGTDRFYFRIKENLYLLAFFNQTSSTLIPHCTVLSTTVDEIDLALPSLGVASRLKLMLAADQSFVY